METAIDLQLPWVVIGGKNITYYLAIGAGLLLAWILKQKTACFAVDAPFYKASRIKWTLDAENLVIDSYRKVMAVLNSPPQSLCPLSDRMGPVNIQHGPARNFPVADDSC